MQPAPSPSAGRGDVVLQPAFFTSVLYVRPLRDDISALIQLYREKYAERSPALSPFALFKQLWRSEGWIWLHFKVFDDRSRETFLLVTMRLFLERVTDDDLLSRVVALFGAYTFYYTQPWDLAPKLRRVNHIPIPIDRFTALADLSEALISPEFAPLREPVLYVTSTMVRDQVFYVLPSSELGGENPRSLPREILVDDAIVAETELEAPKKKGRPSRRDKTKKARAAIEGLQTWLDVESSSTSGSLVSRDDLAQYQADKAELFAALQDRGDRDAIRKANLVILERLREAEALQNGTSGESGRFAGVERVERAVSELEGKGGVLGLLAGDDEPQNKIK